MDLAEMGKYCAEMTPPQNDASCTTKVIIQETSVADIITIADVRRNFVCGEERMFSGNEFFIFLWRKSLLVFQSFPNIFKISIIFKQRLQLP